MSRFRLVKESHASNVHRCRTKYQVGVRQEVGTYGSALQYIAHVRGKTLGEALTCGYLHGRLHGLQYEPGLSKSEMKYLIQILEYCKTSKLKAKFYTDVQATDGPVNFMDCGVFKIRFATMDGYRRLMYACRSLKIKFSSEPLADYRTGGYPWKYRGVHHQSHTTIPGRFLTFDRGLVAIIHERDLDERFNEASLALENGRHDTEGIQRAMDILMEFLPKPSTLADDVRRMEL